MGFGANLAFIAIGAVLAFATDFTVHGINVQMIGWILIAVGVIGLLISFAYVRPRRRAGLVEVEDDPAYGSTVPEDPSLIERTETVQRPGRRLRPRRAVRRTPHVVPGDDVDPY